MFARLLQRWEISTSSGNHFQVLDGLRGVAILSWFGYVGALLMAVTLLFWGLWTDQFDLRAHPTRWSIEIGHLLPALATMLMLFFVFDPHSFGARLLSASWLRFTGVISFEWFLFHGPIIAWFHEHFSGHTHGNVLAYALKNIAPVVMTFIFSALVYRYFSLPILHRVRDRLKKV